MNVTDVGTECSDLQSTSEDINNLLDGIREEVNTDLNAIVTELSKVEGSSD